MADPDDLLVLDTHVWVWVVQAAQGRIGAPVVEEIEAASRRGIIGISAISVWEVAMLEARGRISFALPLDRWIRTALRAPGVRLLPLTPEICIESTRLPGAPHGDPADRMLMATARDLDARLVTADRNIVTYAQGGHLRVLDAGGG